MSCCADVKLFVGQQVTSTIFILALAYTDIVTCSVIIPLTITMTATNNDLHYDFLCKLYMFFITFNVPLAAFIMVAIAVDRYFSICHPFLHAITPRRARLTVCCLCVFSFFLGIIVALAHGQGVMEQGGGGGGGLGNATDSGGVGDVVAASSTVTTITMGNDSSAIAITNYNATVGGGRVGGGGGGLGDVWRSSREVAVKKVEVGSGFTQEMCTFKTDIIPFDFLVSFQRFYASFYLLSLVVVLIIYALIYRSVVKRREWRRRQRSSRPASKAPVTMETEVEAVELRAKNGAPAINGGNGTTSGTGSGSGKDSGGGDGVGCSETQSLNCADKKASKERRDFNFLANIRTAAMCFVVTLVFIVSFLPAWLMAVKVISYHIVVFYLYFIYNVANPVIYAFMNHAFRKELKRVFQRDLCCCRRT
ncbi:hypothetical protein V1264_007917 [Littorina saxatilis]|uniref:G-protein coupled receptors family 1 profile domain-containing protein n=1 Tax=Littorina saxatilis TaxID=31220 RepID=A0AAN9AWE8_9CAEN